MIIRCRKCGEVYDLKSRAAIEQYMKGEYAIGCRRCGEVIWNRAALIGGKEDGE